MPLVNGTTSNDEVSKASIICPTVMALPLPMDKAADSKILPQITEQQLNHLARENSRAQPYAISIAEATKERLQASQACPPPMHCLRQNNVPQHRICHSIAKGCNPSKVALQEATTTILLDRMPSPQSYSPQLGMPMFHNTEKRRIRPSQMRDRIISHSAKPYNDLAVICSPSKMNGDDRIPKSPTVEVKVEEYSAMSILNGHCSSFEISDAYTDATLVEQSCSSTETDSGLVASHMNAEEAIPNPDFVPSDLEIVLSERESIPSTLQVVAPAHSQVSSVSVSIAECVQKSLLQIERMFSEELSVDSTADATTSMQDAGIELPAEKVENTTVVDDTLASCSAQNIEELPSEYENIASPEIFSECPSADAQNSPVKNGISETQQVNSITPDVDAEITFPSKKRAKMLPEKSTTLLEKSTDASDNSEKIDNGEKKKNHRHSKKVKVPSCNKKSRLSRAEIELPTLPPSKSCNFLKSIVCQGTGNVFKPRTDSKRNFKCSRMASDNSKGELPFSILEIPEQKEYLMKTEESFVQDAPCHEIAKMSGIETSGPTMGQNSWCKCRECRTVQQEEHLAVFCRFYGFRKLRFQSKFLCTAGFLLPEECSDKDLQLWLPQKSCFGERTKDAKDTLSPNDPLDRTMCGFLLSHIANRFCDIVLREKEAMSWVQSEEIVFWKKPVAGVREMCDVCETTLFNLHWICRRCGYGVCLDCYERRMKKSTKDQKTYDEGVNNCFRWERCVKGKNHFHSSMLPTQIIPSTCLLDLAEMVHGICSARNIETYYPCPKSLFSSELSPKLNIPIHQTDKEQSLTNGFSPSSNEGQDSYSSRKRKLSSSSNSSLNDSFQQSKVNGNAVDVASHSFTLKQPSIRLVDMLCKESWGRSSAEKFSKEPEHMNRTTKIDDGNGDDGVNGNDHADGEDHNNWLCEGRLLQLTDSQHPRNVDIFKSHWKEGVPVLVSGVGKYLTMELWYPDQLSREYGDENSKNSLVNCVTGSIVTNMKIRDFWDGFENISQRLLDENEKTMILKLKDWPPTQAFHDVMPEVFEDLMRALPLPDYTFINGKCNLASRLPHFFVRPDLGPKMYNAYGWVTEKNWKQGTTNLHLDISDAVNIMVYVGIPVDEPPEARETLLEIVNEGDVDGIQYKRALEDKPGALWHIFHQKDVDKIRKFINKVCMERGEIVAPDHDPIHDQQMYLDQELRHRLNEEYNVEGYAILQCQGDGVFIPAGAPHQVFNLHSCIKIAEDFVSPEHIDKCFTLTNEFRYLSSAHSNHEDKLQIKNIIYHSVKDIVSSAMHAHCL